MRYMHLPLSAVNIKATGNDGERRFSGYASVFGGVDAYGDRIMRGAYAKTLMDRERPVRMRWNHFGPVIGKWLEIKEDNIGLFVEGALTPGHSVAEDAYASLQHGAIDGMSIGYIPTDERQAADGVNELHEIELIEVSLVEEPADLGAKIAEVKEAHRIIHDFEALKDCEDWLRHAAGLSKSAATAIVSRIKSLSLGDPAAKEQGQGEPVAHDDDMAKHMSFGLLKHYIRARGNDHVRERERAEP